jgi:type I restriction enzyme, R subunit
MKQLNLAASLGVAVREYPSDSGPADYVLFVNRNAVGVIEAKKDSAGENLTATEAQTERYANANLKWRKDNTPLRFLLQATGQIIRFTDNNDPAPRSSEVFRFFKPETLAVWATQPDTLRRRLAERMPALRSTVLAGPAFACARGHRSWKTRQGGPAYRADAGCQGLLSVFAHESQSQVGQPIKL